MIWLQPSSLSRWGADRCLGLLLRLLAIASALLLVLVSGFLLRESWPVLTEMNWRRFFVAEGWYPLEGQFGFMSMLWATLAVSSGAILLATPLGIASAIFQQFYAPPALCKTYRLLIALLAGIPSVVFGLWGLTVIVPLLSLWHPPGTSLLAAILILALMILPTVALTSAAALAAVPPAWLNGAAALGMTRTGQITGVALPGARGGILGGILLALARALGETMALLMVAGNVVQTPTSLFDPVRVLTANMALEMAYATGMHRAGLFASGLMLMSLVLLLAWLSARSAGSRYHA